MKKHTFLVFVAYIWSKTIIGLTFYPFKYIKGVVRRPILLPVIFSPIMGLAALFIVGRIAALFITPHGLKREIIVIFLSTTLLSILFWQALLIYLLGSFLIALRRK